MIPITSPSSYAKRLRMRSAMLQHADSAAKNADVYLSHVRS
jgi:hypothetical protein